MANKKTHKDREPDINFALLVRKFVDGEGIPRYYIRSENQGIPDSEVIIFVESWLEKVKDRLKNQIKDSISFGDGEEPKK